MAMARESQPDSLTNLTASSGHGVMAAHGMGAAFFAFVELGADEMAELGFDGAIIFVGVFDNFLVISTFLSNGSWRRQSSRW
jgi:hypothetical protein